MPQNRKHEKHKLTARIQTLLTEAEHADVVEQMDRYRFKSQAGFTRALILYALDRLDDELDPIVELRDY